MMDKHSYEELEERLEDLETECLFLKKSNEIFSENEQESICGVKAYPLFDTQGLVNSLTAFSQDVTKLIQAENTVKESEEKYRNLIELSPDAIAVIQDFRFQLINPAFSRLSGYVKDDIDNGLHYNVIVTKKDRELIHERLMSRMDRKDMFPQRIIMDTLTKDGRLIPCESASSKIFYKGRPAVLVIIRDITECLKAEREIKKREEELKEKANGLEEANSALKVLLKHKDEDVAEVEERVLSNIQTLIMPFLEKLKNRGLNGKQMSYVNILESNLKDIVSPFSHRLTLKHFRFTPSEIQISNLIKQGRSSKEIAEVLNLSERTIETHRKNIRNKTGIKNKKENLRTYLLNLYE